MFVYNRHGVLLEFDVMIYYKRKSLTNLRRFYIVWS